MKIWVLSFLTFTAFATPNYFNTKFLLHYEEVNKALKDEGFKDVYFTTKDNLILNALFYVHPNARANIICFAGWYPGRKETLAPFFSMFGDQYNILFVDARGHGISQGPLFSNVWHYGLTDYYDVLAAIDYMHESTHKPSFIIGICAGAFNTAHAVSALAEKVHEKQLRGIVFDSGWASVYETSYTGITARISENIAKSIAWAYGVKPKQAEKTMLWNVCSTISNICVYSMHTLLFKPIYAYYDTTTNLNNIISQCSIPIFFIHSHDDQYAQIKYVKNLADKAKYKECWWITEPSKHAAHHFKHTQLYKEKISHFFNSLLDQ